jgi:antitoxin component of MazEF toxin-antitoxin module
MQIKIGRWGSSLAVRIPADVAEAAGLFEGELLEVEARGGDLLMHRADDARRADAIEAATDLLRLAKGRTLGGVGIRDLIDDGRR